MSATESEKGMRGYMPYIKTRRGVFNANRPFETMDAALSKYEEWARDYLITSAWIEVRDPEEPWYYRKLKVKLIGVLKKEVDE